MDLVPRWLRFYAEECISKHGYDSSHDMQHFDNVCNYAKQIVDEDYPTGTLVEGMKREDSILLLIIACFSHDLIDTKYVNGEEAVKQLIAKYREFCCMEALTWFIAGGGYELPEGLDVETWIFLIENMSYSKEVKGGVVVPDRLRLIMSILRDADKLDAYRVERVIAYQSRKCNTETERLGWIKTILVKRILMYKDKWLKTACAKRLAPPLHLVVEEYVNENLKDVEMFEY